MFDSFLAHSMMKRAAEKKAVTFAVHDLRHFTHDRHKTCDDKPFGGGPGMLMKPEPVFEALDKIFGRRLRPKAGKPSGKTRVVYLTPQGEPFKQKKAKEFSACKQLIFICGHYEGVDQRVVDALVTDEISIGDYVLTQGEIPAMAVIDATVRLLPGVVGCEASKEFESFSQNLLEYPQYTRPSSYRGLKVPPVLLSGNHKAIDAWRRMEAAKRTAKRRPDLLKKKSR
jgi:tRNA (guanine37-N1)-methyltransferase